MNRTNLLRPRYLVAALVGLVALIALVAGGLAAPLLLNGPSVVSVTPPEGERAANPRAPVRIVFSQPVRLDSVERAVAFEPPLAFTVAPDGPNAVALDVSEMAYGASYRLTIGAGVQNILGRSLDAPRTVAFATAPYVTVAAYTPAAEAPAVSLRAPITVEFEAPVVSADAVASVAEDPRAADALPQPLTLTPEGASEPVAGVGRWLSPSLFGFYPAQPLQSAARYTAAVDEALLPDGSARMEAPFSWSFTTEAPLLAGARPFDGAEEVPPAEPLEIRLHEDVDITSAGASFTLVEDASGATVPGVVEPFEGGFRFRPSAPLKRSARYEARLGAGVTTREGRPLGNQPLSWQFQTIGDLAVLQVEPLPDATEVPTTTNRVSVRFNHPVVALTDVAGQGAMPPALTIDPPLAAVGLWLDTSTFVLSPTTGLAPATTYTVRVPVSLQDQIGGALPQEYVWSFSTIRPLVLETHPASSFAAPDTAVEVIFNQPMDAASLQGAFALLRRDNGQPVAGSLTVREQVATFTPAAPLDRGAEYDVVVSSAALSANGAALQGDTRITFRVAPLPRMAGSEPADGARSADPGGSVALRFSTPMDWGSVERNLVITPEPSEVYTSTSETELYLYFPLDPETDYRITVGADARDPYGVPLGQDASVGFRTAPLPPSLATVGAFRSGAYNANAPVRVPFQYVNLPEVRYRLFRVSAEQGARLISDYEAWRTFQPEPGALIAEAVQPLQGERNRGRIGFAELGVLEPGLYYVELQGADSSGALPDIVDRQVMAVSPYALTIKRSPDRLFVWAVDLATGRPAPGIPLVASWYNYEGGGLQAPARLGTTGADGVLDAAYTSDQPYATLYVWADGAPVAFASTDWSGGITPYDFGLPADSLIAPVAGSLTTDKPIYRPGQSVRIRGVLRRTNPAGGYALPPQGSLARFQVTDTQGNSVLSTTLALGPFGSFNTTLPIAQGAPLGFYSMAAGIDGLSGDQPSVFGSFSVAEYRVPTFEVTVTPASPDLVRGEPLALNVQAAYFTGGAPRSAPVRWRLLSAPRSFSTDAAPNYSFERYDDAGLWYQYDGRPPTSDFGELLAEGTAQTDAQGRFNLTLTPQQYAKAEAQSRTRTLTLDVEVTDLDGQVIASQGSVSLHPAALYAGVRPEAYVARVGRPLPVSLLTVTPLGDPVPNRALEVEIFRREWYSAREQASDGRLYWTSNYTDTLVDTRPATTDAQGRASVDFVAPEGGEYRISVTTKDDQGRTAAADGFVWAAGGDVFWGVDDTSRVELIADKRSYEPGETASVLVTAPYKGMTALVTVERGQVVEHRVQTLQGTAELIQVPITAEHAPNIYVGVTLVAAPGDGSSPDAPAVPDLRVGLVNLPVSTERQELTITVTPDRPDAGPRDTVRYTVKTTDYTGRGVPAEVSLALVDRAVLTLADDPNPTLKQAFYERRPLNVFTSSPLTVLVDRVTVRLQEGDKGGGGAAAPDATVRREFPDTAFWEPALVTGDDGAAEVSVTLPDTLTTWRLTARGVTADTLVGQATTDVVASKPLFLRPTLPRFLTAGDRATLQAVVHNGTGAEVQASVSLVAAAPLEVEGAASQTVAVPANGTALVRWDVRVPLDVGAAETVTLQLSASGGGGQDALEAMLPLKRLETPETTASAGQVIDQVVETVRLPAAKTAGGGRLDVELAPSLTAGALGGITALTAHPYDGAEQSVSKFIAAAALQRALAQSGVANPALATALSEQLPRSLQRLYALQQLDGGWGWWESDASDPWITAYVIQGLVEARRAGFDVDQAVLERGVDFLAAYNDEGGGESEPAPADMQAYKLFVLAEAGYPDRNWTGVLFDRRDAIGMGFEGRAYLLMTLVAAQSATPVPADAARIKTLVAELMSGAILTATEAHWEEREPDYQLMDSNTRATAVAAMALLRADPENFLVPNAIRYLMAGRDGGAWRSTQETAVAALTLAEYIGASGDLEASYSYRVALDGTTKHEAAVGRETLASTARVSLPLADLKPDGSQVLLQRQAADGQTGRGRLYYTMRLRSYEAAGAAQPLDRGIAVRREYIAVASGTLTPTGQLMSEAALGEVVQVRLTLEVPQDMRYLTLEDYLPAGLEALDTSLRTVSAAAQDPAIEETTGDSYPYYWYWSRSEVRDDRVALFATDLPRGTYTYTFLARAVVPGAFQAAPATAYQTYAPEVFGRSAGSVFSVTMP
jgi:alpha-2-macroglobulin